MLAIRLNPWVIFCKAGLHFEADGIPLSRLAAATRLSAPEEAAVFSGRVIQIAGDISWYHTAALSV